MPEPTGVVPIADIAAVQLGDVATFEREADAGEYGVHTARVTGVVIQIYGSTRAMTLFIGSGERTVFVSHQEWRFLGAHRSAS